MAGTRSTTSPCNGKGNVTPIDHKAAKLARQVIYTHGVVRATVMRGSEPVETRLTHIHKQRGQFLWWGVEYLTGHELEVVSIQP